MDSKWLLSPEVAKHLRVSESYLSQNRNSAEKDKIIPYVKLGRRVIYDKEVIDAFVSKHLTVATDPNNQGLKKERSLKNGETLINQEDDNEQTN